MLCYRTTPAQRVWCVTPPTVQLTRKSTELPAATVPLARMLTAVARRSGAAWAANGVTVPVAEMPPTTIASHVHPTSPDDVQIGDALVIERGQQPADQSTQIDNAVTYER